MFVPFQRFHFERDPQSCNARETAPSRWLLTGAWFALLLGSPLAEAVQPADLSLTNTVSNPKPLPNTNVTFTVTVTNSGVGNVTKLTVRDKLPNGYTFVSYTATRGTYTSSNGQWNNFGLPLNTNAQLQIVATAKFSGNHVAIAEVVASTSPDPDSTPNNGNPAEDDYAQVTTTPNTPPVITGQKPQTLSTQEDTALTVKLGNLLVTEPDTTYPNGFTLTLQPGTNYTLPAANQFLPNPNYNGPLTVPVIVNDGISNSNTFNLNVSVTAVPDPPVITGQQPTPLSTPEDTALTVQLSNLVISDPDTTTGFTLTLQPGSNYTLQPSNKILPDPNYNGMLSVPVTVSDGTSNSNTFLLQVSVTPVSDAPVINGQQPIPLSTTEDTALPVQLNNLIVVDPDVPAYPNGFALTLQSGANYSVQPGNQVLPDPDYSGALSVPATVNDGTGNSNTYPLQVTVTAVNDAPVITGQTTLSVAQQTPLTILLEDLLVSDPDDDYPNGFSLSVGPGAGYDLTGPNEITPHADLTGQLNVPVTVNDGSADSAVYPLVVSVTAVPNAVPVITDQTALSTLEDTPLTLTLADLTVADPDNEYPDDFSLTVLSGAHYTVNANEISPDANYDEDLSIPVVVSDGLDSSDPFTLHVTVNPVDDPPQITAQVTLSTGENMALVITVTDVTVIDPDNTYPDDFTLTLLPGTDYTLSGDQLTPDAGFVGNLTVPATVNDGVEESDVFDLLVTVTLQQPSIVMIMLDDLDNRSLQDLLNAGLLPNVQSSIIDRSVDFTQAHVTTPLCCPSRSSYYSGQYPHNHHVVNNAVQYPNGSLQWAAGAFDDSVTIATRLQALGYTTGHIGKWLNGYGSDASLAPLSPAFDPHYVPPGWSTWHGLVDFTTYCVYQYKMNHDGTLQDYRRPPGQPEDTTTYQTNVLADLAESFLLEHGNDTQPFYLEVTPLAPHAERCADAYGGSPPPNDDSFSIRIRPAPEYKNAVVPVFVPSTSYDEDIGDKPAYMAGEWPALTPGNFTDISQQYQQRLRAILSVDDLVGRIVSALGPRIDNTIIVFTSDNGWFYGEHRLTGKTFSYDESSGVPLYIATPGSHSAHTSAALVVNNDLAPTLLDLVSPGYSDAAFDGRSFAQLLPPGGAGGWSRMQFVVEYPRTLPGPLANSHATFVALRSATTLYVETYGGTLYSPGALIGLEKYDLVTDPNEMNSLIQNPEDVPDPVLGPLMNQIHTCQGATCAQYEDAVTP